MAGNNPLHRLRSGAADHSSTTISTDLSIRRNDVHPFPRRLQWKLPGRCGDWLTPPPSPPRPELTVQHDERGVRTFTWPPAGTYTWPPAGTLTWPRTASLGQHSAHPGVTFVVWVRIAPDAASNQSAGCRNSITGPACG